MEYADNNPPKVGDKIVFTAHLEGTIVEVLNSQKSLVLSDDGDFFIAWGPDDVWMGENFATDPADAAAVRRHGGQVMRIAEHNWQISAQGFSRREDE